MKKILIIDDSLHSVQRVSILVHNLTNFKTQTPKSIDSAIELFKTNEYEFVIIEHNCKNSNEFMNFALELKPRQKMILLSDSINCPVDCDTCLSLYKFVRLLKPITPEEVLKYITLEDEGSFFCPNKYRFDSIDNLEKLFEFIHLDENIYFINKELYDDKIIIKSKFSNSIRFNELAKIQDLINKKYFSLKVLSNNSLEIRAI